jgi:hypothetical protein
MRSWESLRRRRQARAGGRRRARLLSASSRTAWSPSGGSTMARGRCSPTTPAGITASSAAQPARTRTIRRAHGGPELRRCRRLRLHNRLGVSVSDFHVDVVGRFNLSSKFVSRSIGRNNDLQNSEHVDAKTEKRLLKEAPASPEIIVFKRDPLSFICPLVDDDLALAMPAAYH